MICEFSVLWCFEFRIIDLVYRDNNNMTQKVYLHTVDLMVREMRFIQSVLGPVKPYGMEVKKMPKTWLLRKIKISVNISTGDVQNKWDGGCRHFMNIWKFLIKLSGIINWMYRDVSIYIVYIYLISIKKNFFWSKYIKISKIYSTVQVIMN